MFYRNFLIAILIVLPIPALADESLTPDMISKQIEEQGAKHVLWSIFDDDKKWKDLTDHIASGSKVWLRIAVKLRAVSDAGASEEIEAAFSAALAHHPGNVLAIVSPAIDIEPTCSGDFDLNDDPDAYLPYLAELDRRETAVRAIADPKLIKLRDKCIAWLEEDRKTTIKNHGINPK